MILAVPTETAPDERRVALVPDGVKLLVRAGHEVRVQAGAGAEAGFPDELYAEAGARRCDDAGSCMQGADVVLRVQGPVGDEIATLPRGVALAALLRPLDDPKTAAGLAEQGITSFALELMPRITRAQSMDVLSSQATVAGYRAVLVAATRLPKMFPMLVTAAGTLSPAKVFVIGAGVAGLQAIATAKRLGAVVEAYDLRAAAAEQVESLGARFVELDLETGDAEDAGGYARAQTEAFYAKQRELMGERAAASDVVVTTALVPGRPAPRLLEAEDVKRMRPGSVVVDLAAPNGGNCEATVPGREEIVNGVRVLGPTNIAAEVPYHASQMFSKNVTTFLTHLADDEGRLVLDTEDEITQGVLLTHEGRVLPEAVRERLESGDQG